jgi:hypothetical protein
VMSLVPIIGDFSEYKILEQLHDIPRVILRRVTERRRFSLGPCSIQDAIRLHSSVLHDFPSVLFRVTSNEHCLCCGVLEETHSLCLAVTTGQLLGAGRRAR